MPDLDILARSLVDPAGGSFAFCGIGVSRKGATSFHVGCAPGITANDASLFRVASVSKIVTAAAFEAAASVAGLERPYDVDAAPILGLDLRHPSFPDQPVTLGMLMTHTSGLWDAAGYAIDRPLPLAFDPTAMFGVHAPGTYFSYCNLGYVLLAAAAERLAGVRFDRLVQGDVLGPHGITGGFNWAGLNDAACARFLPTYRRDGASFVPMIDAERPKPFVPDAAYRLGEDTPRFSPQGGLRTSLRGMLALSMIGAGVPRQTFWSMSDGAGDDLDGLFQDYGAGEQILPDPPFYPRPLTGHFANAYGFNGGVWWDAQADICFAYALNGVAMGDESDALSNAECAIFDAVAQAL